MCDIATEYTTLVWVTRWPKNHAWWSGRGAVPSDAEKGHCGDRPLGHCLRD